MGQEETHPSVWQFGDWRIEPHLNRIRREGEDVQLEPRTMDVLAYFLAHPREVVSFQELLDAFWEGRIVDEGTIHRRILQIRRILGDDARQPNYIETIRKRGYRTVAPIRALTADAAAQQDLRLALEVTTPPFPAYEGNDPYVFVCYAHHDRAKVYPEIIRLKDSGLNIWYDEGISPGSEWTEELARAIAGCARFLYFVSPAAAASGNCRDEVRYAREAGKPIVTVYLEETELPDGLRLEIGRIQALHKHRTPDREYRRKIGAALLMQTSPDSALVGSGVQPVMDHRKRVWCPVVVTATLIVAAAATVLASRFWQSEPIPVVAVLPLDNLSGQPHLEPLADGLAEEIVYGLSRNAEIDVIARSSSFWFKGKDYRLEEIARSLRASHLIVGSIRQSDDGIRVMSQLIDSSSNTVMWSETYDDAPGNLLAFQASVANSIASALNVEIATPESRGPIVQPSVEANELYLLGMQALDAENFTYREAGALDDARAYFERALAIDPALDRARLGLAHVYLWDKRYQQPHTIRSTETAKGQLSTTIGNVLVLKPAARASIEALVEPEDAVYPEYHLLLAALARDPDGDESAWRDVESHLRAALALSPSSIRILNRLANNRLVSDDEKLELLKRARRIDPLNAETVDHLAAAMTKRGDTDGAMDILLDAYSLNPSYYAEGNGSSVLTQIANGFFDRDRWDLGLAWLHHGAELNPSAWIFQMFKIDRMIKLGEVDVAERLLNRFADVNDVQLTPEMKGMMLDMAKAQIEFQRGSTAFVDEMIAERLLPIDRFENLEQAAVGDSAHLIMLALEYSSDLALRRQLTELVYRSIPAENYSTPCDYEMAMARICADEANSSCAKQLLDEALSVCTDRSNWAVDYWALASRIYPSRFDTELTDAIADFEPPFDAVTDMYLADKYRNLRDRTDFMARLEARRNQLVAMVNRYYAAVEANDLEGMLAER